MEIDNLLIVRNLGVRASDRLCTEIWAQIFEVVSQDDRLALLRLMKVCTSWKEFATPLLYRHLKFRTEKSALCFQRHLLQYMGAPSSQSPGRHCWTLHLAIHERFYGGRDQRYATETLRAADAHMIVSQLPNLRSFCCRNTIVPAVLVSLLNTCRATLRVLDVVIRRENQGSLTEGVSLDLISQFEGLLELSIDVWWEEDVAEISIDPQLSYNMPGLCKLKWGTSTPTPVPSFFALLVRSEFVALNWLDLCLVTSSSSEEIDHLSSAIRKHGGQLRRLDLDLEQFDAALLSFCPVLQEIGFKARIPPSSFLHHLPPSVSDLHVRVPNERAPNWQLLDGIIARRDSMPITRIHFGIGYSPRFSWTSGMERIPLEAVGGLLTRALKLSNIGLMVLDEEGNGLRIVDGQDRRKASSGMNNVTGR